MQKKKQWDAIHMRIALWPLFLKAPKMVLEFCIPSFKILQTSSGIVVETWVPKNLMIDHPLLKLLMWDIQYIPHFRTRVATATAIRRF